ncbi:MAG: heterodisulfide reductase [Methanobacterium sp.]|nr:heterodisulfide reductase [Methanobacterium sp.]
MDQRTKTESHYLFKSCTAGSIYPGIELSTQYVLDALKLNWVNDPRQSSCTGSGVHLGVVPMETNMALNARNLSLAGETDSEIICICPMSYTNLKHCQKLISKDNKLENNYKKIMDEIGLIYDIKPDVYHVSDLFLKHEDEIVEKTCEFSSNIKVATHHGCHYSKFFFKDVSSGTFEHPTVLDEILVSVGFEVVGYDEQFLCCGGGLHRYMADKEYSKNTFKEKFISLAKVKPDFIVTQCPGCTFNIDYLQENVLEELKMENSIPVLNIAELLALLLGAQPETIGLDMHAVDLEPLLKKLGLRRGNK